MAVAPITQSRWYSAFHWHIWNGDIDMTSAFAPWAVLVSAQTWAFTSTNSTLASISSTLLSVASYSEKQITDWASAHVAASNKITYTFTVPAFGALERGQSAGAVVVYHKGTIDGVVNPLAFVLDGTDKPLTGGAFTVAITPATGAFEW